MTSKQGKDVLVKGEFSNNTALRIASAFVIGPVFIISILWVQWIFTALMLAVAIGMLHEWYNITHKSNIDLCLGLLIIPQAIIAIMLASDHDASRLLILYYFIVIWSVDSFAMFGGKWLQGPKLAARLSPNKTWSGLISGVLSAGLVAVLCNFIPGLHFTDYYAISFPLLFIYAASLALLAQGSDLFVSYFKRKHGVKDSGNLIPGHGGVLDRFDAILLTAWLLLLV